MRIPKFTSIAQDQYTQDKINKGHWELRSGRILAVKGTNIILKYGTVSEADKFRFIADQHNINLLMGITDSEYNKAWKEANV